MLAAISKGTGQRCAGWSGYPTHRRAELPKAAALSGLTSGHPGEGDGPGPAIFRAYFPVAARLDEGVGRDLAAVFDLKAVTFGQMRIRRKGRILRPGGQVSDHAHPDWRTSALCRSRPASKRRATTRLTRTPSRRIGSRRAETR